MTLLKSAYDLICISEDVTSLFTAAYCSTKNINTLILNNNEQQDVVCEDFKLIPYQLPITGIKGSDYLFDFFSLIGLNKFNTTFFNSPEPISVVMGKHRFDYDISYIKEEIQREFKQNEKSLLSFIEELIEIEKQIPPLWVSESGFPAENILDQSKLFFRFPSKIRKYLFSDINVLYKKHKLPNKFCFMFNAIIFAISGVINKNYPILPSVRVLVSALNGVYTPKKETKTLREEILKKLPGNIKIKNNSEIDFIKKNKNSFDVRLKSFEGWIKTNHVVSDSNKFVKEYNLQNYTRFSFTLHVWVDKEFVPEAMRKFLIYLELDKAGCFDWNNVYIIKNIEQEIGTLITISSFIPYKHLRSPIIKYRDTSIKMLSILETLIPYLEKGSARLYPDPYSPNFDIELQHCFENLDKAAVIYDERKEYKKSPRLKKGIHYCGREILPHLGFEGLMVSGLKIADKITRNM